jgi:hypothetical protein
MSTHLAELLARVRAAPDGPGVAAVFDYDGTLIDGFSGVSFIREQFRRKQLGPSGAHQDPRGVRRLPRLDARGVPRPFA